jgi:hypothetical protein
MPIWETAIYRSSSTGASMTGRSHWANRFPSVASDLSRLRRTLTAANSAATYNAVASIRKMATRVATTTHLIT